MSAREDASRDGGDLDPDALRHKHRHDWRSPIGRELHRGALRVNAGGALHGERAGLHRRHRQHQVNEGYQQNQPGGDELQRSGPGLDARRLAIQPLHSRIAIHLQTVVNPDQPDLRQRGPQVDDCGEA